MLDWLANLISQTWEAFTVFKIIPEYQKGICLRLGKFHKTLNPGFHWKLPFFDEIYETTVVVDTVSLGNQSLITADEVNVSVSTMLRYTVTNVKKYLLNMVEQQSTLVDIGSGVVKSIIRDHAISHIADLDETLKSTMTKKTKSLGVRIIEMKLVDISPRAKVIRLMQD